MADEPLDPGRITKVLLVAEDGGGTGGSQQLPEDPFEGRYKAGLKEPPFPMQNSIHLAEMHPVHAACLDQRALDVMGSGWEWEKVQDDADEDLPAELDERLDKLGPEGSSLGEQLYAAQADKEACAQGYLEVVRGPSGDVRKLFHLPAHTVRVHQDGRKVAQIRDGRMVWFKRWGVEGDIDAKTGYRITEARSTPAQKANEVLVFRTSSRRSTYYGVPHWLPASGWVMLALACRDFNLLFFENRREPRWVIVLEGIEDVDKLEEHVQKAMRAQLREPHRNLIIPIEGGGKAHFHKLAVDTERGSFEKLLEMCDDAILVAHRMPPDRVGITRRGPLGGSVAETTNEIYRAGVVKPAQQLFESRFNRFLEKEFDLGVTGYRFRLKELDITQEEADLERAVKGWQQGIFKLNEARERAGMVPVEAEEGDQFSWEVKGAGGGAGDGQNPFGLPFPGQNGQDDEALQGVQDRLFVLDEAVTKLLDVD